MTNIILKDDVENLYEDISALISRKKEFNKIAVNSNMISLYWEIGRRLTIDVLKDKKAQYGENIVNEISDKLQLRFGKGYKRSSIFRMIKFYQIYPDFQKVATMSRHLTWSHFVELISVNDATKREFYAVMSVNEGWNVRTLRERKQSMLYERTAISKKPEETIMRELLELDLNNKMSTNLFFRDPVVLDFLELNESYSERDLEDAILLELERFILEMGSDFAFLARQKHFSLDGKDYYMDLLFFHRSLRRLVLIELKLGEFEPEYKGQVELYLRWLDKYEKNEGEDSPIALILCAEKSQETIELLELNEGSIHVAQYITKMPSKELLEEKLLKAIEIAKNNLKQE